MNFTLRPMTQDKKIVFHDLYEVVFGFMFGDADGYEDLIVLRTQNKSDMIAAFFLFDALENLYPNGRGGSDDYPTIWKRLEEDWPRNYDYDRYASVDTCRAFYYDKGISTPLDVEYSQADKEFAKSFKSMNETAGGRVNNRTAAIADFDWSTYCDRIVEYVDTNYFTITHQKVTIFNTDFKWDCTRPNR